jgi:hypothetical protein
VNDRIPESAKTLLIVGLSIAAFGLVIVVMAVLLLPIR